MHEPTFTVVIPAHNAEQVLPEQLEALCAQDYDGAWNVIVVDNLSTDGTSDVALTYRDRLNLRVISATDQASAAHARNVGVDAATGAWIVFVDSDDVADSRLLSTYARHAPRHEIMGGRLEDYVLNDPVVASWRFPLTEADLPVALGRFPFVLTSNCAIRHDVFDRIGRFDEHLSYYHEDVDLSIRVLLAGIKIAWIPEATVHYRHRDSLRDLARQQFIWGRGTVVMYEKYGAPNTLHHNLTYAISQGWKIAIGTSNLLRGRSRRGQWIRFASFVLGQVVQSSKMRTWYLG